MQFFPDSSTLSETGAAAPAAPAAPAAGGGAVAGMGGGGAAAMGGPVGVGEIVLNRAESAALAALETEEDEATGHKRARDESGLSKEQVEKLKARADAALKKGFTLKGQGFTKKPQAAAPDEPGLTRDKIKKDPAAGTKAKETNAITSVYTRQARHEFYTLPPELDYGMPAPASGGFGDTDDDGVKETNSRTTMAAMMGSKRRRRMTEAAVDVDPFDEPLAEVLDLTEAMFEVNDEDFAELTEAWSDAARAASAAARRARAKGGSKNAWRKAARSAYAAKGGSPDSEKSAIARIAAQTAAKLKAQKIPGSTALGMSGIVRQMKSNVAARGAGRLVRKYDRFGHERATKSDSQAVRKMRKKVRGWVQKA